jgi:endonuclease/exonuclease/phosphatase family metal-dependent hydrolase
MRIMTFNLRFDNERDGQNRWMNRRRMVTEIVHKHAPTILGTQEGTPVQLDYLQCHLRGYRMLTGVRPAEDQSCQYPTLFYREDAFRSVENGEFWLSTTPQVHRSKNWDSAFPRMMSYGILEDLEVRRELIVMVTHLDHIGPAARLEQARLIRGWWSHRRLPCILMGDFNAEPGSDVHRLLTEEQTGWADSWILLKKAEGIESMTHHDFGGNAEKFRMDWILHTPDFRSLAAYIVRDHMDGRYPSDHFPYVVDLQWR